jgi:hypothetical protein
MQRGERSHLIVAENSRALKIVRLDCVVERRKRRGCRANVRFARPARRGGVRAGRRQRAMRQQFSLGRT